MKAAPLLVLAILAAGCLGGSTNLTSSNQFDGHPACPDSDGVVTNTTSSGQDSERWLYICVAGLPYTKMIETAPPNVADYPHAAVARTNDGIAWVAVDAQALQMVLAGTVQANIALQWESPALPGDERIVIGVSLVFHDELLHALVAGRLNHVGRIGGPMELIHIWGRQAEFEQENLGPQATGFLREFAGLIATNHTVTAVVSDYIVTDGFGETQTARTMIWSTTNGPFEPPIVRDGYWALDANADPKDTRICARSGDAIFNAAAPKWEFQQVMQIDSIALGCRISTGFEGAALGYALPLAGSNGAAGGGSDDSIPYRIVFDREPTKLVPFNRRPGASVDLAGVGSSTFLLDASPDGEDSVELSVVRANGLIKLWGGTGDQMRLVNGFSGPAFVGKSIADTESTSVGWSLVSFSPDTAT